MNSAKCAEPGCTFYASASSKYCSRHTPEGRRATEIAKAKKEASNAAEVVALNEAARWWSSNSPKKTGKNTRYLVLGATPGEERRGRTHYDRNDVYLLGEDTPRKNQMLNYSRYIQADYSDEHIDELRKVSIKHAGWFDEISFDESSMCAFQTADEQSLRHRFESFYIMLKENGVFFLPDAGCYLDKGILESVLYRAGFNRVIKMRVNDLGGDTIVNMLHIDSKRTIIVAVKKTAAHSVNVHGNRGGTHKRRAARSRGKSTRRKNRR